MCVAELALPVLPGLYLGPAQKFSTVSVRGFVQSSPRCPPEPQSTSFLGGGHAVCAREGSSRRHKASIVMLGEGTLCHLSLRRSKTGCKGTADFILLAGALQSSASPK